VTWLGRRTTTPAILFVVALAAFGVVLGSAIVAGELLKLAEHPHGATAFDSTITSWMVAHRAAGLTTLARALSTLGSQEILAPVTGAVALLLVGRRRFVRAALLIAAWGGALGVYNLVKLAVDRPRPPAELWLTKVASTSFPSGHATQSLATFTALAIVAARARGPAKALALALAAAVGWSRVYLGVHWTTDVLAGWLTAAAWVAALIWLAGVARRMDWPRHTEPAA
jgi:undecaprenyl-diphosphatase